MARGGGLSPLDSLPPFTHARRTSSNIVYPIRRMAPLQRSLYEFFLASGPVQRALAAKSAPKGEKGGSRSELKVGVGVGVGVERTVWCGSCGKGSSSH
jgi:hypothetical protein